MAWTQNQRRFSADILHRLGAPVTPANLAALAAWQRSEGGSARFNPFNTTQTMPGAGSYNSIGVRNYTSYAQGLNATVKTITNGRYGAVISALRHGRNPYAVASAVGNSPWGSSGSLMTSVLRGMGGNWPAPPRGGGGPSRGANRIQQVISFARHQLGEPYVWGGTGPSGWDCSGIVYAAYRHAGYQGIGRTTYDQIKQGHAVSQGNLQPGDIVFSSPHHEGLYIGNGRVLSAPHTGATVHILPLASFGFYAARRLIKGGGGVVPPRGGIGGVSPSGLPAPSPAQMRALAQSQFQTGLASAKAMSRQALANFKPPDLTAPIPVSETQLAAMGRGSEAPGVERLAQTTDMLGQIKASAWQKSGLGGLAVGGP